MRRDVITALEAFRECHWNTAQSSGRGFWHAMGIHVPCCRVIEGQPRVFCTHLFCWTREIADLLDHRPKQEPGRKGNRNNFEETCTFFRLWGSCFWLFKKFSWSGVFKNKQQTPPVSWVAVFHCRITESQFFTCPTLQDLSVCHWLSHLRPVKSPGGSCVPSSACWQPTHVLPAAASCTKAHGAPGTSKFPPCTTLMSLHVSTNDLKESSALSFEIHLACILSFRIRPFNSSPISIFDSWAASDRSWILTKTGKL